MMLMGRFLASCVGLLAVSAVSANDKAIRFFATQKDHPHFELAAVQTPLAEVLEVIAKNTGIVIHLADEAKNPVTATCVEPDAQQILECLLETKADMVFRYGETASLAPILKEVWVLRTYNGNAIYSGPMAMPAPIPKTDGNIARMLAQTPNGTDIGKLLVMAQANDPESRANAIATLAVQPSADNPAVRNTVAAALADKSAEVRAQAVFALAKYTDAQAGADLASALQDSDASVRLMVVDSADNHPALLQQALDDSDEAVRSYAASKLKTLASH